MPRQSSEPARSSRVGKEAEVLTRLAEEIAGLVQGPEDFCRRLQGYTAAHRSNVQRVAGELKLARAAFERAKNLWQAGAYPVGLLDPGLLLDIEVLFSVPSANLSKPSPSSIRPWSWATTRSAFWSRRASPWKRWESTTARWRSCWRPSRASTLRLFAEAARRDAATAEMGREVLCYLFKARHNEGLSFKAIPRTGPRPAAPS